MKVIVHYPSTKEKQEQLQTLVGHIHAESVVHEIKKLHCSQNDKVQLLRDVVKTSKSQLRDT